MDAILYIRWSTKDQSEGDSKARQTKLGEDVAKRNQWLITETLIDHGKSAYHGKNRASGGALYQIEERAARGELQGKVLIVEAMDRLSRQEPLESLFLLHDLTKRGLTVCESSSGTIYNSQKITEDWTRLVAILARAAEAYSSSHEKSQRVASAWRATQSGQKTKEGVADPRLCPAWIEVGPDGEYRPIKSRAQVVQRMFQMAAEGFGIRAIAERANEERAKLQWPDAAWEIRNVSTILKGRRVLGEYQPQRRTIEGKREDVGEPVQLYPGIITPELWHQVQAAVKSRVSSGGPRREVVNVLSHLCRCQHRNEGSNLPCNSRMVHRKQKTMQPQLTCASFARAAGCRANRTYRYDDLLNGILDELMTISLPTAVAEPVALNVNIDKAELAAKQARLAEMADKLIEKDDPVLEAAYERFKARVEEDSRALRAALAEQEQTKASAPAAELASKAIALRAQLTDSTDARRQIQTYLDQLIDVIQMDPVERTATVVMFDGLLVFKLDTKGKLIAKADARSMLDVPSEAIIDKHGTAHVHDLRDIISGGNPVRRTKLDEVVTAMGE
ncbi:recombinase family protein [Sphingomonas sp. WKB10]|nr:recombinase family protein [Sphingomonas sp. WKB10]